MQDNKYYDEDFYKTNYTPSYNSAKQIVPMIMKRLKPQSVVDVGCGSGTWIKVFNENGIKDSLGIDFHDENIIIPKNNFLKHDLRKKLNLDNRFELAISLEVAEHIETKYSQLFVDNLVSLSDIVLFSAATPKQEGHNHINEQWHNYWVRLFRDRGYIAIDLIRPLIILNDSIESDYRQNIILFVKYQKLQDNPLNFINYFDDSKQLLTRKSCAKQLSLKYRFVYRINQQFFFGLFNGFVDKIFLKKFFGDISVVDVSYFYGKVDK